MTQHNRSGQGGQGMTRRGVHLTNRQMDVLRLSNRGKGSSTIAGELGIGKDRVKQIKDDIRLAIGLDRGADTNQILARARDMGFIS